MADGVTRKDLQSPAGAFFRSLSPWKTIGFFLVAAFFALPYPLPFFPQIGHLSPAPPQPPHNWPFYSANNQGTTSVPTSFKTSANSIGATFFSHITGIQLQAMPVRICLNNYNKVMLDDVQQDPRHFVNADGAALGIDLTYPNATSSNNLYAWPDQFDCTVLDEGYKSISLNDKSLSLKGALVIRQPHPDMSTGTYAPPEYATTSIDMTRSTIVYQVIFDWDTFFENLLYCLVGCGLLLSIGVDVLKFMKRSEN